MRRCHTASGSAAEQVHVIKSDGSGCVFVDAVDPNHPELTPDAVQEALVEAVWNIYSNDGKDYRPHGPAAEKFRCAVVFVGLALRQCRVVSLWKYNC